MSTLKPYLNSITFSLLGLIKTFAMEDLPCQMIEEKRSFARQRPSEDDIELFMTFVQFSNDKNASRSDRNLMPPPQCRSSKKHIFSEVFEESTDNGPLQKKQKIDTAMEPPSFNEVWPKGPKVASIAQPRIAPHEPRLFSMFTSLTPVFEAPLPLMKVKNAKSLKKQDERKFRK